MAILIEGVKDIKLVFMQRAVISSRPCKLSDCINYYLWLAYSNTPYLIIK